MEDDRNNLTSNDNDAVSMEDTMQEIYGSGLSKSGLLQEISKLENAILDNQKIVTDSNESRTAYRSTISPEESNERRKTIVFLKKDLEKMKADYDRLVKKE